MRSFMVKADSSITELAAAANLAHDASHFVVHASSPIEPDRTLVIDFDPSCGEISSDCSCQPERS